MSAGLDMVDAIPGEKPLPKYIRRSLLALSIDDAELRTKAHASWADAIVLDIARKPGVDWQADLRARMPAAIHAAASGGAEVFVRVDGAALAELDATVFGGLSGVVLAGVRTAADIVAAAGRLASLEIERGIAPGSLEIDVEVDNAAAVWNSVDIARAHERFGMFIVNEPALCRDLGMQIEPELEFDPLEYVKSQLITVALSVGGQAVGMCYPYGLAWGADADDVTMRKAVRRARDTGFKGALCPSVAWVQPCNEGFRPTAEEAAYYVKVIEVFAEGIKRGMASVPLDGKMVDVPVDVRAKLYLKWANRAQARDVEKRAAHG